MIPVALRRNEREDPNDQEHKDRIKGVTPLDDETKHSDKVLSAAMLELLRKEIKVHYSKLQSRMNHILRAPMMVKRPNTKGYKKVTYTTGVVTRPIPKRFNMLDISKYDRNSGPVMTI